MASPATSLYAIVSAAGQESSSPNNIKDKAHHNKRGDGFVNPYPSWNEMSPFRIIWGMIKRRLTGRANQPDTTPPTVAVRKPQFLSTRETNQLRATWLGHACFLVEFPGGLRVLFDPVMTDRCSPFSWLGPKRYTEAPCNVEDIPFIDLVVISHNHYDHLSHPTVLAIKSRNPGVHFFVPLGNKKWFEASGISNVTEMDWWDSKDVTLESARDGEDSQKGLQSGTETSAGDITATIHCLPSQHMSARSAFDRAKTLWASWSINSGGKKLWFAGDTGYRSVPEEAEGQDDYDSKYDSLPRCPVFKEIGEFRGPFDLGLIPIGAYLPRWIMSPMHASPFDSVNIFRDSNCKRAIGMHWGAWVLTEEDVLEPPRLLKKALQKYHLPETGMFDVCEIGESCEV